MGFVRWGDFLNADLNDAVSEIEAIAAAVAFDALKRGDESPSTLYRLLIIS